MPIIIMITLYNVFQIPIKMATKIIHKTTIYKSDHGILVVGGVTISSGTWGFFLLGSSEWIPTVLVSIIVIFLSISFICN